MAKQSHAVRHDVHVTGGVSREPIAQRFQSMACLSSPADQTCLVMWCVFAIFGVGTLRQSEDIVPLYTGTELASSPTCMYMSCTLHTRASLVYYYSSSCLVARRSSGRRRLCVQLKFNTCDSNFYIHP